MVLSRFDTLAVEDLRLLWFYTYALCWAEPGNMSKFFTKVSTYKRKDVTEAAERLYEQGMLEKQKATSWYYDKKHNYKVRDEVVCPMFYYTAQHHPDWLSLVATIMRLKDSYNGEREALTGISRKALHPHEDCHIPQIVDLKYYLSPILWDEEMTAFVQALPSELMGRILAGEAVKMINNDYGSGSERLVRLAENLPTLKRKLPEVYDLVWLSHYVETGQVPQWEGDGPLTQARCLAGTLQYMAEHNYDAAIGLYERLDRLNSPYFRATHLPIFPVLHVLALALSTKSESRMKLANLITTTTSSYYSPQAAAHILAYIKMIDPSEQPVARISQLHSYALQGSGWINQKLAIMLAQWLDISSSQIRECERNAICEPDEVQYMTYATRLTSELIQSLRVKPQWQKVLEMISTEENKRTAKDSPKADDQRTVRLAYFVKGRTSVEVREQKRLKSGGWSSGRVLSESNYQYYDKSQMDDIDLKIKALNRRSYSYLDLDKVLPLLAGTDKLYTGDRAPYQQCTVQEDKPYLSTLKNDDGIVLKSNVSHSVLKGMKPEDELVYDCKKGEYTFYRLTPRVASYLKALTGVGRFPLEAEPQLRGIFEQMKDIVEIHSEMIEGGSTLPQCEAQDLVTLQVTNDHGDFVVKAVVRPLEGGRVECLPGRGEQTIYDQAADGTRYQVNRHKKQEVKNLEPFTSFVEEAECVPLDKTTYRLDPYQLLELMELMPDHTEQLCMEWPEGEKLKLDVADPAKWNIGITSGRGGWFEVEGEIAVSEDMVLSIGQLLELLTESRGRFIRLNDKQFLSISDRLRKQLSRIDAVAQSVRGKVRIPQIGASLIGDALDGEVTISHPEAIDKLRQRVNESKQREADIPDTLNATLREYQETGFRWMDQLTHWGAGVCLADDMGLGKTVQTIAYLLNKAHEGAAMVVAPASVVPNWRKELARFAPTMMVTVLNELSGDDRAHAIGQAGANHIILTTYGLLISEEEHVVAKEWVTVCLDEAHTIKNSATKSSAVCMKLQARNRIILTGTPIQNHLGELWNLFQFINPGLLGSFEQFTHKYINPIEAAHDKTRQSQLKRLVQPFMLRRTKQEVVAELPDKQEITLPVELNQEEMAIYELIRREAKAELENGMSESGAPSINALAMITQLRMAACSASLAQKKWVGPSAKLDAFCDLVEEICKSGNRVLVFSQFTSFLAMAQQRLKEAGWKEGDYFYLDGGTPIKRRSQMVDAFQQGQCPLFMISLKAGGLGLNLTGANYVIHLDPWWNPAIEQQATDRAYRIGQQQKVTVYHLIAQHTIEEKIVRLHQTKRDLADSLLEGTDMSHKITASELLQMIEEQDD